MKIRNLTAYIAERFPPVNMLLFAILYFTVYSVGQMSSYQDLAFGLSNLIGVVAVIMFFFRLRVFDEIKDYQLDMINHPTRVLQSGRVTLPQLITIAILGTVLELFWSIWMGIDVTIAWLVAVAYSLLMRYEFFVGHWLKKHLVLYAISHMLVMPLIIAWIYTAYGGELDAYYWLLAALSLLAGFAFEIARKVHAPDAEREMVDSYSKSIGYSTAIIVVLLILLIGIAVQYYLLWLITAAWWPYVLLAMLYLATIGLYVKNLSKPNEKYLRKAELMVSLFMLISYVSIIIEIGR